MDGDNALGYSGTNSGGSVVIEHSQFDNNEDGVDTNTQIDGDPPRTPERSSARGRAISPITHTHSCRASSATTSMTTTTRIPRGRECAGPGLRQGMTVSGARNAHRHGQPFRRQRRMGDPVRPAPRQWQAVRGQIVQRRPAESRTALGCIYDPEGTPCWTTPIVHDGYFGNPSKATSGRSSSARDSPRTASPATSPRRAALRQTSNRSSPPAAPSRRAANTGGSPLTQVLCDTGFGRPAGANYPSPRRSLIANRLPSNLPTMPNPCLGVPVNAWCPAGSTTAATRGVGHHATSQGLGELLTATYPAGSGVLERRARVTAS